MPITEAQTRRALRHADIPWDREVDDPREDAWVVHDHLGLLGGLAAAFSTGCRSLRRAEDFIADLGLGARRALGLGRGSPCDTTLYRLLAEQSPAGLEDTVFAHVKDLVTRKVVRSDRLALGVMTFDGKGTWSRTDGEKVKGALQSAYDAEGSSLQTFGALRAVLSSSSVCPCVGQRLIGSKEGESTALRELLPKVCAELGGHFRIVTGDAGLCARENAELVTSLARWYLFGLKGNQPHLHGLAREHGYYNLGKAPLARTAERYRGQTIVRELLVEIATAGVAKYYGPNLTAAGFVKLAIGPDYAPTKGDIVVLPGLDKAPSGHAALYNGTQWVSDFKQNGMFVYRASQPFTIYRWGGRLP